MKSLQLVGWQFSVNDTVAHLKIYDKEHSVPKYEICVDEQLVYTLRVLLWNINSHREIYSLYHRSLINITISNSIKSFMEYHIFAGLPNTLSGTCLEHNVPKIFLLSDKQHVCQNKWYRSPSCQLLVPSLRKCKDCSKAESKESLSLKRKRKVMLLPAKAKAPVSLTSPERLKFTLQSYRLENKQLKEEIVKLQEEIACKSLPLYDDLGNDLKNIMSNSNSGSVPPFMKLFWEEQQKYLSSCKKGVRYHPMIIRYCLGLAAKSPAVYDEIRFDEKSQSGFVILPSR